MSHLIALDIDGTYSIDPDLWDRFIAWAHARGHTVVAVTMRHEHETCPLTERLSKLVKIFYTGRAAKAAAMAALDIKPNIWIDDNPLWIFQGAAA